VANTKLLKTYSEIDSRVLPLAFVIKHWAKARLINSPGDGTLSSYGYILCLIHYLQHRPVPVLPNLQQLPPDWDGNPNFRKEYPNAKWNRTIESHPVDGSPCDTYFYNPRSKDLLRSFAARNRESTAELLAGFFQYFAWEFDYRRSIVSIQAVEPIDKLTKAETDCWNQHDRISIEDPFETWYDVAHVVKSAQMFYIRKEFLRAHTLISRCASHGPFDSLPSSVDPQALLGKICERCEEREKPPVVAHQKNDDNEEDI
jgi:terminal uridylyltransferase